MGHFASALSTAVGFALAVWLLAVLVLALVFGVAVSVASVALEELCFQRCPRFVDLVRLFGIVVLENLGLRQIVTFWRVYGLVT